MNRFDNMSKDAMARVEEIMNSTKLNEFLHRKEEEEKKRKKERQLQEAVLAVRQKYGKNAILKGTNLAEGATGKDRNRQIGGHKA